MSTCGCEPKKYNISLGCCVPVVAPADQYYTKYQTDKRIEEAISGITVSGVTEEQMNQAITSAMTIVEGEIPSLSGYATEQWVENKGYITGVDLSDYATLEDIPDLTDYALKSEIPSLSGYATEQWVLDKHYITGVDLSDYVTYESLPDLTGYATKEWVINQNYVVSSELIQYVSNLQNQIDSLKQQISGCCGDTGETLTRWITMTGENDYTCSGTTKMTKEKEQQSTDGINWTDTGNYRTGSTVLEMNSVDCGYQAPLKFYGILRNGNEMSLDCNSSTVLTREEVYTTRGYSSITIGDCVTTIGEKAFVNEIHITGVTIPSGVTNIQYMAFADAGNSTGVTNFAISINEGLITIGNGAFYGCRNYSELTIPNSVKTIGGNAFYMNNIKTLVIGSGVTSIGSSAFARSSSISGENITILAAAPPTLGDNIVFNGWNCPIYVPSASVNAYKSAWTDYASRIQAIP